MLVCALTRVTLFHVRVYYQEDSRADNRDDRRSVTCVRRTYKHGDDATGSDSRKQYLQIFYPSKFYRAVISTLLVRLMAIRHTPKTLAELRFECAQRLAVLFFIVESLFHKFLAIFGVLPIRSYRLDIDTPRPRCFYSALPSAETCLPSTHIG